MVVDFAETMVVMVTTIAAAALSSFSFSSVASAMADVATPTTTMAVDADANCFCKIVSKNSKAVMLLHGSFLCILCSAWHIYVLNSA